MPEVMLDNVDTLSTPVNEAPVSGHDNPAVKDALRLIGDHINDKLERDRKNAMVAELLDESFEVHNPSGTKKITSKMLQQAFWRMASRMKPLDFQIHGTGQPESKEKVVTAGVSTVMKRGDYVRCMRDKHGAFHRLLLTGDAFIHVGAEDNKDNPIQFNPVNNANVYVDGDATGLRSGGKGRDATKMCIVFSMNWDTAIKEYPELEKTGGIGEIPKGLDSDEFSDRTLTQEAEQKNRVEIAHYYDIVNKNYTVFAGSQCTVLEQHDGDDYKFVLDGEPYIPVIHFICNPATKGFWNNGALDAIFDLAIIARQLLNQAVEHVGENVSPITLLNIPQGTAAKFFNDLAAAYEIRAAGGKAVVPLEYDPASPNAGKVATEALLTPNLIQEWQIIFEKMDNELKRLGINLDEADYGANVTATQILKEESAQNAYIQQVMEYNASETEFAVRLTLDFIKKFVTPKNDTLINLTTKIPTETGENIKMDNITLGALSDELSQNNYFVFTDSRSGVYPTATQQIAEVSQMLSILPPGSPAHLKMIKKLAEIHNKDISIEDIAGGQQAAEGGDVEAGARATQTDRIYPNPRASRKEPTI